ncbi:hypothetical protein, partial [Achromobacter xylosoxidans]|uniref:hypothetical protein n=1 Tax=Alcaligenes xylosoxydans xylosoxydans TaxID=85698 RepID=UPI001EEF49A4
GGQFYLGARGQYYFGADSYGQVLFSNPVQTGCKATNPNPNPIPNPKSFTGYASVNSVCAAV